MSQNRLISLDAFRGFTVAAMILVNFPGSWSSVYPFLLHSDWDGLTPTDLIFPFFLFIVGVSISLSYSKFSSSKSADKKVYNKILIRTFKLFAIGIFLNLFPDFVFSELRVAGVLQRIAIVFLFSSILFLNSNWKQQFVIGVSILLFYFSCMILVAVPGVGTGVLLPGSNLAAYIDSWLLPGKMWNGSWDPEGIFSTLPAIGSSISGMLVGRMIISSFSMKNKLIQIFFGGLISVAFGFMWSFYMPTNKNLWSPSFVLISSGLAAIVLSILIILIDLKKRIKFAKFGIVYGSNAIAAYTLSSMVYIFFYTIPINGMPLASWFMDYTTANFYFQPQFSSMLYAMIYVGVIYLPILYLYRRKIFIKL